MVDDHLAEEATSSQQDGQVPVDREAGGQHDDIWCELRRKIFMSNFLFLNKWGICNLAEDLKFILFLLGKVLS